MVSLLAPVLGLALAQVAPALPPEAPVETPVEVPVPPVLAPTPAGPLAPPGAPDVRFERLADGGWRVTRDGEAVTGPDLYRAVLRFDLQTQAEQRRFDRHALLVSAGVALLAGPGLGWIAAESGQREPGCAQPSGPVSCADQVSRMARDNAALIRRDLLIGAGAGVVVGGLLAWWGLSIEPLEPTAAEAEALVEAARGRWRAAPQRPPTVGLRLGVEALPGGAALVAAWRR